ncbi:MAG: hypothetical protein JWL76_935 [Thermoleophilia bacterium]|nr:hypothetical protein [Thermoleophilia bacterium]
MIRRFAPLMLVLLFATLVAAGCGEYGQRYEGDDNSKAASSSEETPVSDDPWNDETRKRDGCTDVKEYESAGRNHTDGPYTYEQNPPVSGDHNAVAKEWGLYDTTQPDGNVVHNLEHGHIVITHKGLSQKEEDELLDQARINPYHLLVMPRKKNPKDGVYYSVWTAQVYCKKPSAAALQYMIEEWRDQGPELFTEDASMGTGA